MFTLDYNFRRKKKNLYNTNIAKKFFRAKNYIVSRQRRFLGFSIKFVLSRIYITSKYILVRNMSFAYKIITIFTYRWQQKFTARKEQSTFCDRARAFLSETTSLDFSHVSSCSLPVALMTRSSKKASLGWRLGATRGTGFWVRKSNLIFSFVLHRPHVRARKNIGRRSSPFVSASRAKRGFLSVRVPRCPPYSLPVFPPSISSLEGERWWHQEGCQEGRERRRKRGEREECEMAAAAKRSRLGQPGRKLSERGLGEKKPPRLNYLSRGPSETSLHPPPVTSLRVPSFYSAGRFSRGNLISPSTAREERWGRELARLSYRYI